MSKTIMKQIFTLALLILALKVPEVKCYDLLPNSKYLFMGFDSVNGSLPCIEESCLNSAFRTGLIFDNTQGKNDDDCGFKIPLGTTCVLSSAETVSIQTNTYSSLSDVSATTENSEGTNVGYRKRFSASQSYTTSKMTQSINSQDSTTMHSFREKSVFTLSLNDYRTMPLSSSFKSWVVDYLPAVYDSTKYYKFIAQFGMNFVKRITYGGRIQQFLFIQNTAMMNYQSSGHSAVESAQVHFFVQAGFNDSSSNTNTDMTQFNSMSLNATFEAYGGSVESKNGTYDLNKWAKNLQYNGPLPLYIQIAPLDYLLTKENFPNDPNIQQKKQNFKQGLEDYFPAPAPPNSCPNPCQNGSVCQEFPSFNIWYCDCTGTGYGGSTCTHKDFSVQSYNPIKTIKS